ncbi:MAG: hypothetical protein HKO96_02610 [Flavobacteriaceae bacterium]|nr:hypothetical protein [Flavobacteriaceae bacterium]NNL79704.1 hypothetical protein [Flavobacteriaceae bacterium]
MKSKLVLSVLALAFIFTGCSDEPVDQSAESTISERGAERPFKVRGAGVFNLADSDVCAPLATIIIEGTGNGTHIGNFDVLITECNDLAGTIIQNGIVTAANGDELYFVATNFSADDNGPFGEYDFEGGTGRFEDSYGYLKLYNTLVVTGPGTGTYSNQGEGYLAY